MATSYTLKQIPEDVFKIVQKEQSDIKIRKGTNQFSWELALYKMIKDYEKCRQDVKFKPEPV